MFFYGFKISGRKPVRARSYTMITQHPAKGSSEVRGQRSEVRSQRSDLWRCQERNHHEEVLFYLEVPGSSGTQNPSGSVSLNHHLYQRRFCWFSGLDRFL